MILKLLLNIQMILKKFKKILKNTIQIKKILFAFDVLISDLLKNKKLNLVVTELIITGRKVNFFLVFITQTYFAVPKNVGLNSTHYFIMKIPNEEALQQMVFNPSSDIVFNPTWAGGGRRGGGC